MFSNENDIVKLELSEQINENNPNIKLLFLTFKSDIQNKNQINECQILINEYYEYSEQNNIKYNVVADINIIKYNSLKFFTMKDLKKLFLINKNNTEKCCNSITIIINNFWIRQFLNIFFSLYTISVPINFIKK
tara:strand:+ start:54 stop:455 length:402 start_codon:yes stop_codon:yes gene_type:complete